MIYLRDNSGYGVDLEKLKIVSQDSTYWRKAWHFVIDMQNKEQFTENQNNWLEKIVDELDTLSDTIKFLNVSDRVKIKFLYAKKNVLLNDWERSFIRSIVDKSTLSLKEYSKLQEIYNEQRGL